MATAQPEPEPSEAAAEWPPFLEPMFPSVDPKTFLPPKPPHEFEPFPTPSGPDIDRLYRSEELQLRIFGGLRTWETIAVNSRDYPSSDEEHIWWSKGYLAPDESTWFRVFRRSHWRNSNQRIVRVYPELKEAGFGPQDCWSIDNPRIWWEVSKAIQLANKMLHAAADGEWLQNSFDLANHYQVVDTDPETKERWITIAQRAVKDRLTAEEVRDFIDSDEFHKCVSWVLLGTKSEWMASQRLGVTHPLSGYPHILIILETGPLRELLRLNADGTQSAVARMQLAMTMVHELAHATMSFKTRSTLPHPEPSLPDWPVTAFYREHFYGKENMAECGHSLINSVFNADLWGVPNTDEMPPRSNMRPYWLLTAAPWPDYDFDRMLQGTLPVRLVFNSDVFTHAVYALPSGWARVLQLEEFWTRSIGKYGPKALHFPRVLRSQAVNYHSPFRYRFTRSARWSPPDIEEQPEYIRPHLETVGRRLRSARRMIGSLRPWHFKTRLEWSTTPYSHVVAREALEKLTNYCFKLPRTARKERWADTIYIGGDIQDATMIATSTTFADPTTLDMTINITNVKSDARVRCLKAWFYWGMSVMAYASLPARDAEEVKDENLLIEPRWERSATATSDPHGPDDWPPEVATTFHGLGRHGLLIEGFKLDRRHKQNPHYPEHVVRGHCLALGNCLIQDWIAGAVGVPVGLRGTVDAEYVKLKAQLVDMSIKTPGDGFLDFSYRLPPYVHQMEGKPPGMPPGATYDACVLLGNQILQVGLPDIAIEGEDLVEMWTGLHVDRTLEAPPQSMHVARTKGAHRPSHLTLAQIYDLRGRNGCAEFVFVRSAADLEAYDPKNVMRVLQIGLEELQEQLEHTSYGWCLNSAAAARFLERRQKHSHRPECWPVAKVIQWVTLEEVAMMDGKDGRPMWIMAGNDVYDVSELSFYPPDAKLVWLLRSQPGGNPMQEVRGAGYKPREVVKKLHGDRVAMIRPIGMDVAPETTRIFSSEELGWYEFRGTGMYIQIYDDVYDIGTEYIEFHPGGMNILAAYAGRDATEAFEKYHPENGKELLKSIQALKIGRVVKTYQPTEELPREEVRIRNLVFRCADTRWRACKGDGTEEFEENLRSTATDPSFELEPLVELWNDGQHLVVGKVATPPDQLPRMTKKQLAVHDGQIIDQTTQNAAFMAADGLVYDVSTLLLYGHQAMTEVLSQYVGGICHDKGVAAIMKKRYAFRAVGRLSKKGRDDGLVWDPRRVRDDVREADLQRVLKLTTPPEKKKRKFEPIGVGPWEPERPGSLPAPVEDQARKRKCTWGEEEEESRGTRREWLDWRTEGLVEKLQEDLKKSRVFERWQSGELERTGVEKDNMEGYWKRRRREVVV